MEDNTVEMQFRDFFRTSRDFLLFPLILAGAVVGFMLAYELMGAASFQHPWTWILPVLGLAIFSTILWFFNRGSSFSNVESPKFTDGHRVFDGVKLGLHLPLNPAITDIEDTARHCYGYGRWDAPYWFIGLEEGMGANETIQQRLDAWLQLEREGLSDCREFHLHKLIDDKRWHMEPVRLQSTWRPLILLLMTFLNQPADKESLRKYQSCRWGRRHGETCVIELSGLPAHDLKVPRDRKHFRQERIESIRAKIREHNPEFVVMYGRDARETWKEIAGCKHLSDTDFDDQIFWAGPTMMVSTTHPTAQGVPNQYWVDLGNKLKSAAIQSKRYPPH